jgi:hypothetical protein
MADEINAGGNPGAEGAAPSSDAASPVAGTPAAAGAAPAGGAAISSPAGSDAPKDEGKAPAEDKKADAKDDAKPADDKKAAEPVDYGKVLAEVKLPEGMTLDQAATKVATELFGELNLTPEAAKKLTDFYVSQQVAAAQNTVKAWNDLQEKWKAEATADSAITPELKAEAKTVFGVLSKESRELLEGYGMTNFGPLLKDLAKFHEFVADDTFARGGASKSNGDARGFFPNSNMNP